MSFSYLFKPAMVILLSMWFAACVKDVDLNQSKDISLQPEMQVDLLISEIEPIDFNDPKTNLFRSIIRDTVRLEFLDDDYVQKDLAQVEFRYRYTNSFPQAFYTKITFLSEEDVVQHLVEFPIAEGSAKAPVVTENIDFIEPDRIEVVRKSIKMVVEIESLPGPAPFTGKLNFASKGLFFFEF